MTDFTNRTIDSAVDAATGTPPPPAPVPNDEPDSRAPIVRGTHNPDNQLQGGPGMFHAVRGFAKAYNE